MPSLFLVHPESISTSSARAISRAVSHARANGIDITTVPRRSLLSKLIEKQIEAVIYVPSSITLHKSAITEFLAALQSEQHPSAVYSDGDGFALPDFSPQRFLCQNYLRGPIAFRGDLDSLRILASPEYGDIASVYATLFDVDLRGELISHIPFSLFSSSLNSSLELVGHDVVECSAVLRQARESRGGGTVGKYLGHGAFESQGSVVGNPLVSIVIPTQGIYSEHQGICQSLVVNAVSSIVELTDYLHYEIVVVVDSVADERVLSELKQLVGQRLQLVEWTKPFNFSQKMNFGVLHARGEYVLLLNDDVEVLTPQWLTSMLTLAQLPNAGMAGAMLYYEDDTIQHAGHAYFQGSPTHIGLGLPRGSAGPLGGYLVSREAPGVTAACALIPLKVFKEVGGFTALLPGNFNDVDLCLKVGWRGYDIYWTPEAKLYHFESKTRDAHVHYYELDVIEHRWGLRLDDSRYWRGHPWAAR